jgi:hypothetical protein
MFVNQGTLDILVQGAQLGNGALHINLSLPPYMPVDEHVLFPPFRSAISNMNLNAQSSALTRLSCLMRKTYLLPDDHHLLNSIDSGDALVVEDQIWMLEFATLCMLIHLRSQLQEFRNINPDLYHEVFPNPVELTTDVSPRMYLHYRSECAKHLAQHFSNLW